MARRQSGHRGLKKVTLKLAILRDCVILFPVMRDRIKMLKEWRALPENERPTWEQFKRGLKTKKVQECECEICEDSA